MKDRICHKTFSPYQLNDVAFVSLYDGTCDQTKELKQLLRKMYKDDKWVISSTGHNMFVSYSPGFQMPNPGFLAKIHYGNEIIDMKYLVCLPVFIVCALH